MESEQPSTAVNGPQQNDVSQPSATAAANSDMRVFPVYWAKNWVGDMQMPFISARFNIPAVLRWSVSQRVVELVTADGAQQTLFRATPEQVTKTSFIMNRFWFMVNGKKYIVYPRDAAVEGANTATLLTGAGGLGGIAAGGAAARNAGIDELKQLLKTAA